MLSRLARSGAVGVLVSERVSEFVVDQDEWAGERGRVLVFERNGLVYVYWSPAEAAGSIESEDFDNLDG